MFELSTLAGITSGDLMSLRAVTRKPTLTASWAKTRRAGDSQQRQAFRGLLDLQIMSWKDFARTYQFSRIFDKVAIFASSVGLSVGLWTRQKSTTWSRGRISTIFSGGVDLSKIALFHYEHFPLSFQNFPQNDVKLFLIFLSSDFETWQRIAKSPSF